MAANMSHRRRRQPSGVDALAITELDNVDIRDMLASLAHQAQSVEDDAADQPAEQHDQRSSDRVTVEEDDIAQK